MIQTFVRQINELNLCSNCKLTLFLDVNFADTFLADILLENYEHFIIKILTAAHSNFNAKLSQKTPLNMKLS